MNKINTSPLSGMQELLPTEQAVFDKLKQNISDVYRHYGFMNIETPIIERTEVLLAKAGGDTEKQIYMVSKTAESDDSPDQALRFDHTVPLARYVVEHNNDLAFPFQVTQINRNFRGERAQRGRFREFYQCDADIVGRDRLPVAYDAKVISCIYEALKTFNLPKILIRISNRKVLAGFINSIGQNDNATDIASIIDHAEKVSEDETRAALNGIIFDEGIVNKIWDFMHVKGSYAEIEGRLGEIMGDLTPISEGLAELKEVTDILSTAKTENFIIDFMIIRGLDYYTGTVFETMLEDYSEIGSIASGGRYDNLCGNFTDQHFPGVGGSIGLTRLFFVLRENNLIDMTVSSPIDFAILPISPYDYENAFALANRLRADNKAVDVDLTIRKLGDKLARAAKIAKYAVVVGGDEAASQKFVAKNLQTGEIINL